MSKTKEFNRSICFTFFEDHRITAKELEKDCGKEIVADYYNAIADYSLYGIEPELHGVLKYLWPTTKSALDKSIERRASGFSREENTEQTEKILAYKAEHPNATQRVIAEATGISLGKVNKVLNNADNSTAIPITNADSISSTNTTSEREHEHVSQVDAAAAKSREREELDELTNDELKAIQRDYKNGIKFPQLCKTYNIRLKRPDDTFVLTLNLLKDIDQILKGREKQAQIDKKSKQQAAELSRMGITLNEADELTHYLFGNDTKYENIIWEDGDSLDTTFGLDMTAKEQLRFFSENSLATYETYHEYIPRDKWLIKTGEIIYPEYSNYLDAYIADPENMAAFAQALIDKTVVY